jgi:hypothetical protein
MVSFLILLITTIVVAVMVHLFLHYLKGDPLCSECSKKTKSKSIWDALDNNNNNNNDLLDDDDDDDDSDLSD